MRCQSLRYGIRFPDVHLRTAAAVVANASICVVGRWDPAFDICLAIDEFQVSRALAVAIPSLDMLAAGEKGRWKSRTAVFGSRLISWILAHATIGRHGDKVHSTVQATWKIGYIHIKGEFFVQETELLVRCLILQQVQTRSDICVG